MSEPHDPDRRDFEEAAQGGRRSFGSEMLYYVRGYKRWSLVPLLLALALLGAFISLGGSGVAPFIYALF